MKELIIFIVVFVVLFWIGTKLNRWVNGSQMIAKNQKKILEELKIFGQTFMEIKERKEKKEA